MYLRPQAYSLSRAPFLLSDDIQNISKDSWAGPGQQSTTIQAMGQSGPKYHQRLRESERGPQQGLMGKTLEQKRYEGISTLLVTFWRRRIQKTWTSRQKSRGGTGGTNRGAAFCCAKGRSRGGTNCGAALAAFCCAKGKSHGGTNCGAALAAFCCAKGKSFGGTNCGAALAAFRCASMKLCALLRISGYF